MARIGYAARGLVFLIIGAFALFAAGGFGTKPQGAREALEHLVQPPFGRYLLWPLALGLLCFAGWRVGQSLIDSEGHGKSVYGLMRRAVLAGSGLFYLVVAVAFVRLSLASRPMSDDEAVRQWTAWVMAQPFGRVLLALIAGGFVAVALGLAVKACRAPERHRLKIRQRFRPWILLAGSFGTLTRAVVFLLIGVFLALAAYDSNSREAASLAGVLRAMQQQSHGAVLLAIAAMGLLAFGLFEIIEAAARRTEPGNRRARRRDS